MTSALNMTCLFSISGFDILDLEVKTTIYCNENKSYYTVSRRCKGRSSIVRSTDLLLYHKLPINLIQNYSFKSDALKHSITKLVRNLDILPFSGCTMYIIQILS